MIRLMLAVLMILIPLGWAQAASNDCFVETDAPTLTAKTSAPCSQDTRGNIRMSEGTLKSGEDQLNNVIRTERQPLLTVVTADTLVLTGAGRLSSIVCWGSDAAATAGTIDILDATAAGGTPKILSFPIAASLLLPTVVAGVDIPVTTGIYVDYSTTNDVSCTVLYRPEGVSP